MAVRRGVLTLALFACLAVAALAQPAPPVAFEVTSVKVYKPGGPRHLGQLLQSGHFTFSGLPLRFLIAAAYNVGFQSPRLTGGPAWINSMDSAFVIEAMAPRNAIPADTPTNIRDEKLRQLMQSLLAERFNIVVRRETKEMPVYALVVGKNGSKLQKSKIEEADCPVPDHEIEPGTVACHSLNGGRGRGLHGEAVSLADVLSYVENWTDRPLVDKTGIKGLFNVQTTGWTDIQPGPAPLPGAKAEDGTELADLPNLFGVFERLGLKLEAQKAVVETFVIERVEKPTEN